MFKEKTKPKPVYSQSNQQQFEYDFTQMNAEEVRVKWHHLRKEPLPKNIPHQILARLLAHQLQVERFGGLNGKTRKALQNIETALKSKHELKIPNVSEGQLNFGTQLVREYRGVMHRVNVTASGFAWEGKNFLSLSSLAKAITGTTWNGHRFFGLKPKNSMQVEAVL